MLSAWLQAHCDTADEQNLLVLHYWIFVPIEWQPSFQTFLEWQIIQYLCCVCHLASCPPGSIHVRLSNISFLLNNLYLFWKTKRQTAVSSLLVACARAGSAWSQQPRAQGRFSHMDNSNPRTWAITYCLAEFTLPGVAWGLEPRYSHTGHTFPKQLLNWLPLNLNNIPLCGDRMSPHSRAFLALRHYN